MALPQVCQPAPSCAGRRDDAPVVCERLTDGLRNERATDAFAIGTDPLRVGFAQNHAYRWQDRDVQNCAELVWKLDTRFEQERDAAIA
jgi:hypothetical protein